jgi:hypothetical protein
MKHAPRKVAVVFATVFAIGSPAWQATTGWGLSASEFAEPGNETLRAAGYAFSIWSVIYLGVIAFAVYQLMPKTDGSATLKRAGWPAALAIFGCGAWIWASAADREWASVAVIVASAGCAIAALLGAKAASKWDRLFVTLPIALLAGWLTIASAINLITVATELGYVPAELRLPVGIGGVLAVWAAAFAVLRASRVLAYGLPVAWGLVAVFVAERIDSPAAGWTALAAAAVLLVVAGMSRPTAARR